MCGRYALAAGADTLVETFQVPPLQFSVRPCFNVAPGQEAMVVARDGRGRRMGLMRWGLAPPGRGEGTGRGLAVNARGETAWRTPSFREPFHRRRCLVPADGFYEWRKDPGGKTPYYFRPTSGGLLALGGIWDRRVGPDGALLFGFVVLTVEASTDVAPVHGRMPVLVGPQDRDAWLDPASPSALIRGLVVPAPPGALAGHRVSSRVNRVDQDDPGLVEPA